MKKIIIPILLLSVLVLWVGVVQAEELNSEAQIKSLIQKGDEALRQLTESNCRQAIESYEAALKIDPNNYEANWKNSKAYCLILDLKTAGLIYEKEEYKPYLKELGGKAEHYAAAANAVNPKGLDALIWYNSSYGYHAASMGIVQAILKGAGGKLKKLAGKLIEIDDTASDGLGYRMLGRLYLSAPFPVGSKKKAVQYLEKAVQKAPNSLFDHYWLGQAYLAKEKNEAAKKEFQFVLDHSPTEGELHFSEPTQAAARAALAGLSK